MTINEHDLALYSPAAEESFLGAMLIAPEFIEGSGISPDDFAIHKNRFIWEAVCQLSKNTQKLILSLKHMVPLALRLIRSFSIHLLCLYRIGKRP